MARRSGFWLQVVLALAFVLVAGNNAAAQSAKDLVGTWAIVSAPGFAANPTGMLMFDTNGRFIQVLTRLDIPKYAANNRSQGTAEENKATVQGSIGFFGTYTINGTDLIRHIEGSSYPNYTAIDQKLGNLTVSADELKWTNPVPSAGGPAAVFAWKRVK